MSKDVQSVIIMALVLAASAGIGTALILKVPQRLHTPLMSMTNALSAVTILGALLLFTEPSLSPSRSRSGRSRSSPRGSTSWAGSRSRPAC